ncbi:PorT family protein [Pedobacter sp. MC2016-14]|uniref:porin family protein n=1 Tax=Pedobacter sp. MC2016-14 TaxID=2897327 RepID=UPI001E30D258|nr:porin family protein [Pedobacter sp. MC2016-14]MCD0490037.1 PorT family protein [Pedobacter sp. MC2016-14]
MKISKLHLIAAMLPLAFGYQLATAQTKVGIRAGVNFSSITLKDEEGNKAETQSTPGILLGLTADVPVMDGFFIQPGLLYSRKGYNQETGGYYDAASNFRVNVTYIELPVNVLYKPKFKSGNLVFGAGPYLAYGTGGKWKSDNVILIGDIMTDSKGNVIFRNDYKDGEFENYLYGRPFDYGANFLAGYEFMGRLSVQLNAQIGLANLQPMFSGVKRNGAIKNKGFGLSVGYKF